MGIEPTPAAPLGLENKQFGPDGGPLQTTTLLHRIMTVRPDGVAYDSITRWATGAGRGADLHKGCVQLRLRSSIWIHTDMTPRHAKSPAAGVLAALLLSACGSNNPTPWPPVSYPAGSYDLQVAMTALVQSGLGANVDLSGTAIVNGTSNSFTGTGTLTLSPGVSGMFNGTMAQLQTQSISGTVTVAGQTSPYSTSVVNAYEPATAAIAGEFQSTEFDVAQQPIVLPTALGTSVTMLGTLSRYSDSTLSVALGTVQVSVAVTLIPVDPGTSEVVQFTYQVYDTNQALVETETFSYNLTENNLLAFNSAATQNASGTLTVMPQLAQ
jgi:hypothetical protein